MAPPSQRNKSAEKKSIGRKIINFFKGGSSKKDTNHAPLTTTPISAGQQGQAAIEVEAPAPVAASSSAVVLVDKHADDTGLDRWTPKDPTTQPIVDIVFVHGLTGKRAATWTAEGAQGPWPKYLLSEKIPEARIFTFGYDADVVHFTKAAGKSSLREHGKGLMTDLSNERYDTKTTDRPLIFVAHSLGGLVCEQAILTSFERKTDDPEYNIFKSTKGIMFLGTPHAGSDLAKFALAVGYFVKYALFQSPNNSNLRVLEKDSEVLAGMQESFYSMLDKRRDPPLQYPEIEVYCFIEDQNATLVGGIGKRVVDPESAKFPGRPQYSATIPANHMDMTKFKEITDVGYKRVSQRLRIWVDGIAQNEFNKGTTADHPNSKPIDSAAIIQILAKEITAQSSDERKAYGGLELGSTFAYRFAQPINHFVSRRKLTEKIQQELRPGSGAHQTVILIGIPGQGKTQLARDFCAQAQKDKRYLFIFWVDASSGKACTESFEKIWDLVKPPHQIVTDTTQKIAEAKSIMCTWTAQWLLVFDNYDDPRDFPDLRQFMPVGQFGSYLITTRNTQLNRLGGVQIPIGGLTEDAALTLLRSSSGIHFSPTDKTQLIEAQKIVERLGYLALAIDQAGAYIRGKDLELQDFLPEFENRKETVLKRIPDDWEYRKQEEAISTFATWDLSFTLLDDENGGKVVKSHLLAVIAFLDFRNVSEELFATDLTPCPELFLPRTQPMIDLVNTILKGLMSPILSNDGSWDFNYAFRDVLGELSKLSLVQLVSESAKADSISGAEAHNQTSKKKRPSTFRQISLHPLVADWVKLHSNAEFDCFFVSVWIVASWVQRLTQPESGIASTSATSEDTLQSHITALEAGARSFINRKDSHILSSLISEIVHKIRLAMDDFRSQKLIQLRQHTSAWLSRLDSDRKHSTLTAFRAQNAGSWITKTAQFQSWIHDPGAQLVCYGPPGTGKSTTASFVIDYLNQTLASEDIVVLFTYIDFNSPATMTFGDYIGNLLRQVYLKTRSSDPEEQDEVAQLYAQYFQHQPSAAQLYSTFQHKISNFKQVYIVVDALDEIRDESNQRRFLEALSDLGQQVKLLVFGRPTLGLDSSLHRFGFVSLQIQEHTQLEINAYVQERLSREVVSRIAPQLQESIQQYIVDRSRGSFLWTTLTMDGIIDAISNGEPEHSIHEMLMSTPPSLADAYERNVTNLLHSNKISTLAGRILGFVIHSYRCMTFTELRRGIAISPKGSPPLPVHLLKNPGSLEQICHGFLTVDLESQKVKPSHRTVVDYFVERERRGQWPRGIYEEFPLLDICLQYLLFEPFESEPISESNVETRIKKYQFLTYACIGWGKHALESDLSDNHITMILELLASKTKRESLLEVANHQNEESSSVQGIAIDSSPLQIAAAFGLTKIVNILLADGHSPLEKDSKGNSALSLAQARMNNWATIEALQNHDAVNDSLKVTRADQG